jgi:hypothetical protein
MLNETDRKNFQYYFNILYYALRLKKAGCFGSRIIPAARGLFDPVSYAPGRYRKRPQAINFYIKIDLLRIVGSKGEKGHNAEL